MSLFDKFKRGSVKAPPRAASRKQTSLGYIRTPDGQFKELRATKAGYDTSLEAFWASSPSDMRAAPQQLVAAYFASVYAFQCIELRANKIASLPWQVYNSAGQVMTEENPVKYALEWAYATKQQDIFYLWARSRSMYGETFLEPVEDFLGTVHAVQWINNLAVEVVDDPITGRIKEFRIDAGQRSISFMPGELVFEKRSNPANDNRGIGRLQMALDAIGINRRVQTYVKAWFSNGAQPGLVFTPKSESLTKENAAMLRDTMSEDAKGVANWFEPLVMPVPMDVETVEAPKLTEQQVLTDDVRDQICNAIGVPRGLVDHNNAKYQLSPQQNYNFIENEIIPEAETISRAFNAQFMPRLAPSDMTFEFDLTDLRTRLEDEKTKTELARSQFESGGITYHEYRQAINMPAPEAEDFVLLPSGFIAVPLSQLNTVGQLLKPPAPTPSFGFNASLPPPTPKVSEITEAPEVVEVKAVEITTTDPTATPDDMTRELNTWQKYALRHGVKRALDFSTYTLSSEIADAQRSALNQLPDSATRDDIREAFNASFAAIKALDVPVEYLDFWKQYDALQSELGESWLNDYMQQAWDSLSGKINEGLDAADVLKALEEFAPDLETAWIGTTEEPGAMLRLALAGMAAGQAAIQSGSNADPQKPAVKASIDIDWSMLSEEALAFVKRYLPTLIRNINLTTAQAVNDAIAEWMQSGGSVSDLKTLLQPIFNDASRAALIAQTESTRAYAEGSMERYRNAGVERVKTRNVKDSLVCPICDAAAKQIFTTAAAPTVPLHPGCRCYLVPDI